jgi:hypothetical protein
MPIACIGARIGISPTSRQRNCIRIAGAFAQSLRQRSSRLSIGLILASAEVYFLLADDLRNSSQRSLPAEPAEALAINDAIGAAD